MADIQLRQSPVVFLEAEHQYWNGFNQLQGVTGILSQVLFPNKYAGIDPDVLDRAARRGSEIHTAIQDYEMNREHVAGEYEQEAGDCLAKWQTYQWGGNLVREKRTIMDEYLVSNETDIASKIDLVLADEQGNITLADIKTTQTYDAQYLSWQLSIYAYLFERQNPELKVSNLEAVWFHRTGDNWVLDVVPVERKTDADVEQLFTWWRNGEVHEIASVPDCVQEAELPAQVIDIAQKYADLEQEIAELTATRDEFRAGLLKLMQDYDIEKFALQDGKMKVTRIAPTTRISFDSARFKAEHEQMYHEYEKVAQIKETIKITISK